MKSSSCESGQGINGVKSALPCLAFAFNLIFLWMIACKYWQPGMKSLVIFCISQGWARLWQGLVWLLVPGCDGLAATGPFIRTLIILLQASPCTWNVCQSMMVKPVASVFILSGSRLLNGTCTTFCYIGGCTGCLLLWILRSNSL